MRKSVFSTILLAGIFAAILISGQTALADVPLTLYYQAETYGYVHAEAGGDHTSETQQDSSINEKSEVYVYTQAGLSVPCPPPDMGFEGEFQDSYARINSEGASDGNGVQLVSRFHGFGYWFWWACDGSGESGDGGGDGNGYTSLVGTITVGESCPPGIHVALSIDAEVLGDVPGAWQSWQWQLKIWDEDANYPLVVLNDSNMSANLDVLTGQILNIKLYH